MDYIKLAEEHLEQAIDLIKKLVSFPSVLDEFKPNTDAPFGTSNKEALEYILNIGQNDGFKTKNVNNYAGHIEYNDEKEIIGILAHLDVVPVTNQKWSSDPFKAYIKDGKLYGRGTTDDKGPLVCAYIAMKILKEQNIKLNKNVRLIMGCDEESGSRCLEHYFNFEPMPELGFSPDAEFPVIYGEKAIATYEIKLENKDDFILDIYAGERSNIVPALAKVKLNINLDKEFKEYLLKNNYKGFIDENNYYVFEGISSHSMAPENGLNAISILAHFLNEYTKSNFASYFTKYFSFDHYGEKLNIDLYDDDMGKLTSNPAIIRLENNVISLLVNYRIPSNNHFDNITESIKKTNCLDVKSSVSMGHYVPKESNLVKVLLNSYQEISKDYSSKPFTIGGGTYSKFIDNCVAFGPVFPGREDVCHIADEYINISDIKNSIAIYAKAIYDLGK